MAKKRSRNIDEIIKNKWLVEFNRKPLAKHPLYGFVIGCSNEFTLIHQFDRDLFNLDGYCVFPNKDVKNHAVYDDESYFLSEVVRVNKLMPKARSDISIVNWEEVVRTVGNKYRFLVVETERLHKNECYIGEVKEIRKKSFILRAVDTDASWYDTVDKYKYSDLTMIKFGGRYEETLALVNREREAKES